MKQQGKGRALSRPLTLWCTKLSHRYFCTTKLPPPKHLFLIPLVKVAFLTGRTKLPDRILLASKLVEIKIWQSPGFTPGHRPRSCYDRSCKILLLFETKAFGMRKFTPYSVINY